MASKTPQRVDIQGLRALAVLLVLADHVGVGFLAGGYVGVDVFFVISGFLISSLLFAEIRSTGRVSIARFYARRARRILPASTVLLVTTLVFVAVTSSVTRVGDVIRDTLWAALFLANVNFARQGRDYSDMGASVSAVQHFWSLAVEEQFYLVWPALLLLLALLWRRRAADGSAWNRRILLRVVLVGFTLSLLWSVVITVRDPQAAYFSTPARAWELAGGALVALLVPVLSRLRSWVRLVLSFGGVVAVAAAALRFDSATPFPGWVALLPVLGTMAILAAGTGAGQPWPGRLLTIPPGPWVGDISYSLYRWHWPVIVLGREQFPEATAGRSGTILLVAVSVLLAALSYYFVEEPFRRGRVPALSRGRGSLTLWPATAACVVLATLAAYGFAEYRAAEAEKERRAWFADRGVHISVDRSSGVREVQRALRQEVSLAREGAPLPPDLVNSEHLSRDLWQIEYPCRARWKQDTTRICPVGDTESD
jgi:peptidoglycan/LPS O-acetylase OafA/YrhL